MEKSQLHNSEEYEGEIEPPDLHLEVFEESSDEGSDALEIVTSEPELGESNGREAKRQRRDNTVGPEMPAVLINMEEEIERQLDAKAAKSNLTVINVKNILKHVITNEHVLAMVRRTIKDKDDDDNEEDEFPYEPKLTRAKAKELLKTQPEIPWPITPAKKIPTSECQVLIDEELSEESSDEEYRPNEDDQEQSDEEKENESQASDIDTQPPTPNPPTPKSTSSDCGTQTSWTDDGLFKIPKENIGQRTRSKLSLSDTPLELIEKAFVPPDITTDMYDSECDDEDWKDFLQNFAEPLTTVVNDEKDDDEADPEYNVLADEEKQKVDKEELRMDKAVKVSKKELNMLVAELFEYTDMLSSDDEDARPQEEANKSQTDQNISAEMNYLIYPEQRILPDLSTYSDQNISPELFFGGLSPGSVKGQDATPMRRQEQGNQFSMGEQTPGSIRGQGTTPLRMQEEENQSTLGENTPVSLKGQNTPIERKENQGSEFVEHPVESDSMIEEIPLVSLEQKLLLEQQMRKHVQLTTQHFLQTHGHPILSHMAGEFKNILVSLKYLQGTTPNSAFKAANLEGALNLVSTWEKLCSESSEIESFISQELDLAEAHNRKKKHVYQCRFPPVLLTLVSQSDVFLYPLLLPAIPFRCAKLNRPSYAHSEDMLIAIGLEEFEAYVKEHPTKNKVSLFAKDCKPSKKSSFLNKVSMMDALPYIHQFLVPTRDARQLYFYIRKIRLVKNNPIQYYFEHNEAPATDHYVIPFTPEMIRPPCKQPKELLPEVWREYLYPKLKTEGPTLLLLRT